MGGGRMRAGALGAAVLTLALFASMVEVGARAPGQRWLSPLRESAALDYSAPPVGGFAPLDEGYLREVLGSGSPLLGGAAAEPLQSFDPIGPRLPLDLGPLIVDHPLTNDDLASAYSVARIPFTARTSTTGATRSSGTDPSDCTPVGDTVWYRFVPTESTGVTARVQMSSPVTIGAFVHDGEGVSTTLGCASDPRGRAALTIPLVGGTAYVFQITAQIPGPLVFSIDPTSTTTLASVSSSGAKADTASWWHQISADGRFVVFLTTANLDPRYHHDGRQSYVRDLVTGTTELVSLTWNDKVPNWPSGYPVVSGDGRYVVWATRATNVTPEDTVYEPAGDVFLRDRLKGTTELVSIATDGSDMNGDWVNVSTDGRFVTFGSFDGDEPVQGWVRDRLKRTTTVITTNKKGVHANGISGSPAMSADGRYFLIESQADNLVPGSTTIHTARRNQLGMQTSHVYVKDLRTGDITAECLTEDGNAPDDRCWASSMSADGRYVVFWSAATNLIDRGDQVEGLEAVGDLPPAPPGAGVAMYCYVRDRWRNELRVVTVDQDGNPVPTVWTRQAPGTWEDWSLRTSISADGRFIGFETTAQLLPGDSDETIDAFVYDQQDRRTTLLSEGIGGAQAELGPTGEPELANNPYIRNDLLPTDNPGSMWVDLSADGRVAAFQSSATNLVEGDTNNVMDVFVRFLGAS